MISTQVSQLNKDPERKYYCKKVKNISRTKTMSNKIKLLNHKILSQIQYISYRNKEKDLKILCQKNNKI